MPTFSALPRLLNRARLYCLYLYEFVCFGEFDSIANGTIYTLTRKSYSRGKRITSRLGVFETRMRTLDFLYVNYAYEVDLKNFIKAQQFDVFLDVGACIGEYCVWLGRKGYRCFAFEPVPGSYEMITKNLALNKVQNKVTAFNYGLGEKNATENFKLHPINPGASKRVAHETEVTRKVEIRTLDDVYESLDLEPSTKILVKIDIEGMEVEMLKGAQRFLKNFSDITLIIEENITGSQRIMQTLDEIAKFEYGVIDIHNIYAKKVGSYDESVIRHS